MKCISFEDTSKEANIYHSPKFNCNSLTRTVVTVISESITFILPQTDFSVKVKGQTSRGREMDKRTDVGKETTGKQNGL